MQTARFISGCLGLILTCNLGSSAVTNSPPRPPAAPSAAATTSPSDYPSPPAVLPGKGLGQHDFLYTGEWDTRKTNASLFLIKGGKVVWTYQIPRKDEFNGEESEFSDMHGLSNG